MDRRPTRPAPCVKDINHWRALRIAKIDFIKWLYFTADDGTGGGVAVGSWGFEMVGSEFDLNQGEALILSPAR